MSDPYTLTSLSPTEVRQILQACDRFETAWKTGPRPDPEEFLVATEPGRSAQLRQLLILDWDYRRQAGHDPGVSDYLARFPCDAAIVEDVGREMAGAAESTRVGADDPPTPWTAGSATGPADEPAAVGGSVRYELGPEVGRGGIGVVYRGRDRLLGRDVAIKVLREALGDKAEARRRFAAEARVGGRLQHPAIVAVYDHGRLADGRSFLAMKLVEGHTLAALLRDRANGDLPRLLGVFEQVCQAVAYAHAQGIVHRDLKPANIMVGTFGEVQVMDWGFAKVLVAGTPDGKPQTKIHYPTPESNGVSQSGMMMGTPAYMPPEQARGEASLIDPRADVFALGAILCEILTGRPPYTAGAADDVWRKSTEGDLSDAHARLDACEADTALRDLARRCLAAERANRPADAGIVAKDVSTYLTSAQERLREAHLKRAAAEARAKAERRAGRLTMAAAAALLVGAGIAAWQAVVATRAQHDAVDAQHAAQAAAAAEKEAKEAADAKEKETRAVLDFVQKNVFAAARPEGQQGGLGHDVTLRAALEAALPVVERSFTNQPLIEARLHRTLGASFIYLGEARLAGEQYQRAHTLYAKHAGPDHPDTLWSLNDLANTYDHLGQYQEALKLREETLALHKAKLGSDDLDTLNVMGNLAITYNFLGRYADGARVGEETLAMRKAKLGPDHPDTVSTMNNLAFSYAGLRRYADALKLMEETFAYFKAKLGPEHPQTLGSMINLANSYSDMGRHAAALKLREETLAIQKVKLPPNHPNTLWSMHNLANSYAKLDRHAEAFELREETLALREAKLGPRHPDTLRSLKAVAESLIQFERGAEAVAVIDDCVRRSAGQVVHPKLIPGVMDLRLQHFARVNDAAGCRATAEMWEALQRTDADSLYSAARYRAVTAKVLRSTDADAEAGKAMVWLKQAFAAGYKDVANLQKDTDLDALRAREDFRSLAATLAVGKE